MHSERTMLIFLSSDSDNSLHDQIMLLLEERGVRGCSSHFGGRTVIVVAECPSNLMASMAELQKILTDQEGVEEVVSFNEPYKLCARRLRPEGSRIQVRDFSVGRGSFGVIAGPCTIETEKRTLETAIQVKKAGATALRGGAFKPRTSPYSFQGLKLEGLKILAQARKETGLAIVTEAMSSEEVRIVAEYADVIQIGTRNAQNYRLLETCGEMRVPILLKRGYCCTLSEFLMAAEYILSGGNEQVILCERGIRTFETYIRYTMAIDAIPALQRMTHLPVVVDPSHATGRAEFVPATAYASVAAGADGLLVEVHPDPQNALCDGRQSLTPEEFAATMKTCRKIRKAVLPEHS